MSNRKAQLANTTANVETANVAPAAIEAANVEAPAANVEAPAAPIAPAFVALPQTSNPDTRIARAMHALGAKALWAGLEAPTLARPDAASLQAANAMPPKCYAGQKFDVARLPQSGAWLVGFGNKAAPARGDGQGGAAGVLAALQAASGVGAGGVVCLRAFVLALCAAGVDCSICGGATRAFTNSDKGKRGPNGGTLAPFTLYVAPPV